MATPNIVPRADSEGGLGTSSKYWASAYIDTITTTSHINLPDNAKLKLGDNGDLSLNHAGTSSVIQNATGNLTIQNDGNNSDIIFKGKDDNSQITALTLDMSEAGAAIFNGEVTTQQLIINRGTDGSVIFKLSGTEKFLIGYDSSPDGFRIYNHQTTSAPLFIDSSSNAATFISTLAATSFNGIPFYADSSAASSASAVASLPSASDRVPDQSTNPDLPLINTPSS